MRRTYRIAVGLLLAAAAAALAQHPRVTANAVGYVRRTLERGKMYLMCLNYDNLSGNYSVSSVFPPATCGLPNGTLLYFWDAGSQRYGPQEQFQTVTPPSRWSPGTNIISVGESFWLKVPAAAPDPTCQAFMSGNVPVTEYSAQVDIGLSFVSYGFPLNTPITNTSLGSVVGPGTLLYYWDPTGGDAGAGGYSNELYQAVPPPARWHPGTYVFKPGEGVMLRFYGATNWAEPKPYTWP